MLHFLLVIPAALALQGSSLAGTYRMSICKTLPCTVEDTAGAHVFGYLVLSDTALATSMFPQDVWRVMNGRPARRETTNACFSLRSNSLASQTYAGIGEANLIHWAASDSYSSAVEFYLYRSPDAQHRSRVTIVGGELSGTGRSAGVGMGAAGPHWGDDIIVGRKIGPMNLDHCTEGARRYAEQLRGGFAPHAISELPAAAEAGAAAGQRYVLLLSHTLLRPAPPSERASSLFRAGLQGVGRLGWVDDIWTVGPSVRREDPKGYVDEVVSRVSTLLSRGVPATHINIVGLGPGATWAMLAAQRIQAPVGVVFVGSCEGAKPAGTPSAALDVLDVFESASSEAERCASVARLNAKIRNFPVPTRPAEVYNVGGFGRDVSKLEDRPGDWLDAVVAWIRAR